MKCRIFTTSIICLVLLPFIGALIVGSYGIAHETNCEIKEYSYKNDTLCFLHDQTCQTVCAENCDHRCGYTPTQCYELTISISCDKHTYYFPFKENFEEELEEVQSGFYICYKNKFNGCGLNML